VKDVITIKKFEHRNPKQINYMVKAKNFQLWCTAYRISENKTHISMYQDNEFIGDIWIDGREVIEKVD